MEKEINKVSYLEKLKKGNNILTGIAILFAIYLITFPFMPMLGFFIKSIGPVEVSPNAENVNGNLVYEKNQLIIPEIGVNEEVIETDSIKKVHDKVWHRPGTGTPSSGNMVLVAHRYATIGGNRASTFYNLPDMKVNDEITLWWEGKEYKYQVVETFEVTPDQVEIEAPTTMPVLTLYTCTPLWKPTHRAVVRAVLIVE